MTALKDLQSNFKLHLVGGDASILSSIISTDKLSNVDRLAIYGYAYYARLIEALAGDFEALHTLLGDEEFDRLCRAYIDAYPSRFFSLRWFGQFMPEFIRHTEPYAQHEYLYEMAKFEWLFTDAFDAEDIAPITESDVARVPAENWPQLKIKLHPSVLWFSYCWNILPVYKAIKEEKEVPELKKLNSEEYCLIWRQELKTRYRTLEPNEALLIQAVEKSSNFSQWCELLVNEGESPEEVPMIAAGILKSWLGLGMIEGVSFDD